MPQKTNTTDAALAVRIAQARFRINLARINNRTDILKGVHSVGVGYTGRGNRSKINEGPGLPLPPRLQRVEVREALRAEALVGQWGTFIAGGNGQGGWDYGGGGEHYVPDVLADWARPLESDI